MLVAYLATAGVGWLVLGTAPIVAAWLALLVGLTGGGVVGISVPMIVHIPLIFGALLLRR